MTARFTPHHKKRKYAAFYRTHGCRNWTRIHPDICGSKASMVRAYQNWLIAGSRKAEHQIRPIRRKKSS